MNSDRFSIDLSIVIPVLNEEKNLEEVHTRLVDALSNLELSHEIIFVDDGSSDGSFELMKEIAQKDHRVKVIKFRRNFGQTAAISAGFHHSRGEIIITMDADLQNDPVDIERLIAKLNEGYDVISGWRRKRKDGFILRLIPSKVANWLIAKITRVPLHDFGCTLKAYRREIVENINLYGEMHRFIPALARWIGAEIAEIEVTHHPRTKGKSKYGISRLPRVILDLVTVKFLMSFSTRPIQIFGTLGLISGFMGFLICSYLSFGKIFWPGGFESGVMSYFYPTTWLGDPPSLQTRMPLLLLGILLLFTGMQFITMGLLGELIVRTYYESQDKPIYAIKEIYENVKRDECKGEKDRR